jgi:hypothetical protein
MAGKDRLNHTRIRGRIRVSTPPPMDYVEFSVSDIARTKAFYAAVFGW